MATPEIDPDDYDVVIDDETYVVKVKPKWLQNAVLVQNNGCIQLDTGAAMEIDTLTLNGNATIDATQGIAGFGKIKVYGTGNELIGKNVPVRGSSVIVVDEDADLTLEKEYYDSFVKRELLDAEGRIYVKESVGITLTGSDIQRVLNHTELSDVVFLQDLDELKSITFKDKEKVSIGFQNACGTAKADSITFGKNTEIDFGTIGYEIDLLEGNNKLLFGANASASILSDLVNVSSITVNAGVMKTENRVTVQGYTQVHFGNLTFSDERNSNFKINKFSLINAASITGDAKRTNTISLGSNSELVTTGDVTNLSKYTVTAGSAFREYSSSPKQQGYSITTVNGTLSATDKANTYKIGNYSRTTLRNVDMKLGNDTFSVGTYSYFFAETMTFGEGTSKEKDTFTIGSSTYAEIDEIFGVYKFTVSAGKNKYKLTTVQVDGDVTGTPAANTFAFGNFTDVNIGGLLEFAGGKNKLTVGTYSTVVLKADEDSAALLGTFTLGKYSTAYFSTELKAQFDLKNTASKQAKDKVTVYDIGTADVAVNFTSMADELADNDVEDARAWSGKGWLSSLSENAADECDFVEVGELTALTVEDSDDFCVTAVDAGLELEFTDNRIDLTAYAGDVLKIELITDDKAVSYQLLA